MSRSKLAILALALPLSLLTSPAEATTTAPTYCAMDLGSVNAAGVLSWRTVTASPPPTVSPTVREVNVFEPGEPRLTTTWSWNQRLPDSREVGLTVDATNYIEQTSYVSDPAQNPAPYSAWIGGGWASYNAIALSVQPDRRNARNQFYGLSNGTLNRWVINSFGWTRTGSAGGFSAVKTWALISQTTTYDTFLATTRGGALYTIRVPLTSPMKPVVKQVRSSTWQGFEYLVAQRCGQQSTLLTAVDTDTDSAYLYAISHANGTSTVIQGLGKLPGTYADPVYFLRTKDTAPTLFGE